MRRTLKDIKVTSERFNTELLTQFPVRASRRAWCHWILIRRLSTLAFSWHVEVKNNVEYFIYEGIEYKLIYANNFDKVSILQCQSVGVSMRVFTDIAGTVNYIAVVTQWKEGAN